MGKNRGQVSENLVRENLYAIEIVEIIVEIVDAELIEVKEYASMGKKPADRVKKLLVKLDFLRRNKERGYKVTKEVRQTSRKFAGRIEKIFKNLPKPLECLSFLHHDLPVLMDISEDVKKVSIQNDLNRSQTKALEPLKAASYIIGVGPRQLIDI